MKGSAIWGAVYGGKKFPYLSDFLIQKNSNSSKVSFASWRMGLEMLRERKMENPMATMPGTSMMSAGVPDPSQRADLVAYLQWVSVRTPAEPATP